MPISTFCSPIGRSVQTSSFQERAGEAAAQLAEWPEAGVAVENGVDRLQRPALVEDDPVLEQAIAVEHDTGAVEVVEQEFGFADEPFLGADAAEVVLGQPAMAPLLRLQSHILFAHRLQTCLDALPRRADARDALGFAQKLDRLAELVSEIRR